MSTGRSKHQQPEHRLLRAEVEAAQGCHKHSRAQVAGAEVL